MRTSHAMMAAVVAMACATAVSARTTPSTVTANDTPRVAVLAELFTSEGCSSCPPADDLLRQLLREQPVAGVEVIAISEHVDYWNRLGWRDPFSSSQFSDRQSEYARSFGDGQIYTPQLVIDGSAAVVGNDAAAVRQALVQAVKAPRARLSISGPPVAPGCRRRDGARTLTLLAGSRHDTGHGRVAGSADGPATRPSVAP